MRPRRVDSVLWLSKDRDSPLFREVQKFRQPWLVVLVVGACLTQIVVFGLGLYQQLVLKKPFHVNEPVPNVSFVVTAILVTCFSVGMFLLFWSMRLVTEVHADGLFIRFLPIHRAFRKIPLEDATKVEAVTYRPVLQYGGWGIKGTRNRRAYNVRGNRGVRIDYADSTHILIGSQRSEELARAIESITGRNPAGERG